MSVESAIYDSYDPRQVNPRINGETPAAEGEQEYTEQPVFDARYRDPLNGLLFIGALRKQFTWMGHTFVVRTLMQGEYAEVGILAARYRDTDFSARAFQIATIAAALETVDGKPLPTVPISNEISGLEDKFNYIMSRWFSFTFDAIFTEFMLLEGTVKDLIDELGKAPG